MKPTLHLVLAALLGGPLLSLAATPSAPPAEKPVVRWTANQAPDFRYQFIENLRVTPLLQATPETGTFNLHGYLKYFQGVLFACWDSQARDENTAGQHGVFRFSADGGETWSDLRPLFPPLADNLPAAQTKRPGPFQTSQGFAEVGGRLYAVTCVDRELKEKVLRFNEVSRTRIGFLAREVRKDGTLGDGVWGGRPPNGPGGRGCPPPPPGPRGDVFGGASQKTSPEPGYPAHPAGPPELVAAIRHFFQQPAHLPQLLFGPTEHPDSDDEHRMTEPTPPWRLDHGTWVRLYRDQGSIHGQTRAEVEASKSRRNYAAFSFDDGRTWTKPTRTSFPDSTARSNAGRLPDGQYFVINNPLAMPPGRGGRTMLAISLSRDGLLFDRFMILRFVPPPQRYPGKAKTGTGFQYPHSVVVGEHLWVIYSVNKEDMEVARIPLTELARLEGSPPRARGKRPR